MEHGTREDCRTQDTAQRSHPGFAERDVEAAADIAGQTLTVWVSRTLNAALRATTAAKPAGKSPPG